MKHASPSVTNAVCVYGASADSIGDIYKSEAFNLGRLIAQSGHTLVCGGGSRGLMRAAIDGALSANGHAIGVLPQFMVDAGWQHPDLSEMIVTPDMHSRKNTMASLSIAAIALPGGVGTFEELLEIITWRKLNLFSGKVVILNTNDYYCDLIRMLRHSAEEGFSNFFDADGLPIWEAATTADEAIKLAIPNL